MVQFNMNISRYIIANFNQSRYMCILLHCMLKRFHKANLATVSYACQNIQGRFQVFHYFEVTLHVNQLKIFYSWNISCFLENTIHLFLKINFREGQNLCLFLFMTVLFLLLENAENHYSRLRHCQLAYIIFCTTLVRGMRTLRLQL